MKSVKIGFIALAVITLSFITSGHLYTKEKVAELGANIGVYSFDMALYSENPQDGVMGLASLLTSNMGILGEEFISYENNKRENKWRDLIASNPSLAYSAFDMYSTTFIENYQTSFEEYKNTMITSFKENPSEYSDRMLLKANSLNSKNALKKSVENMKKYDKLISELLKLDDVTLNKYIKSIAKDPSCFWSETEKPIEAVQLRKWLGSKSFITPEQASNQSLPYYGNFPSDLILLTNRVSSNYPKWTNRKFLQEAKKFSMHVQKNLKY